ncbi:MAG: amidohydrolase family protein [Thermodesulfobacteriota bacterium]
MHYHRAGIILDKDFKPVYNAALAVENGIISDFIKNPSDLSKKNTTDHGPGILIPGLINAHTHLDLSFLKNRLDYSLGFASWVKQLIKIRENTSETEKIQKAKTEIDDLFKSGTAAVGDISSLESLKSIFINSPVSGFIFYEEIGQTEKFLKNQKEDKVSYAAHAPHTTSPELIKKIKKFTDYYNLPFSVHCCESDEEKDFLKGNNKNWEEFLNSRNIDFSSWPLPSDSGVKYLDKLKVINKNTLLVHLLNSDKNDFEIVKKRGASVCACPRSNKNLHAKLPDIEKMLEYKINLCLGTDSLASCESLDVFDEMKFVYNNYKSILPKNILKMTTINPAKVFNSETFYAHPDKKGSFCMVYISDVSRDIFESIIFSEKKQRKPIL